jgi:orotate phosphoribosyltransferase
LGGLNSQSYPVCFDRKEEKTHGEGGSLIGSVKDKRVIVVDDVLTAGTALKNSINLVQQEGGVVVAAAVALDREEKEGHLTIRESLEKELHIPIKAVASISNLLSFLEAEEGLTKEANLIKNYLSKN